MIRKKDPEIIKQYLEDSSNLKGGWAEEVCVPENPEELSHALRNFYERGIPVTISGSGTSTTGSRIPFGGTVISLERFNKIINLSAENMTAVTEAGVLVDELKTACADKGLFYASHPTEGSATIGGTVATNASGARSFKYGPTRSLVKKLKLVFSSGRILEIKRGDVFLNKTSSKIAFPDGFCIDVPMASYSMPAVKNASGYFYKEGMDLIDLFIGQEGTLAIVIEAELALASKPYKIISVFIFFREKENAWGFASEVRDISKANRKNNPVENESGYKSINALSIEYFDDVTLAFLRVKNPFISSLAKAAIFFEQDIFNEREEDLVLSQLVNLIDKYKALTDDTLISMNEKDVEKFSMMRHAVPEAINDIVRRNGFPKFSADIAVSDGKLYEMMSFYDTLIESSGLDHAVFGHISEDHVHANLLPRDQAQSLLAKEMILKFIKKAVSLGGAVSAEHGIGKLKHEYLKEMYGEKGILDMARIKKALDPKCILGLGNIFPRDLLNKV